MPYAADLVLAASESRSRALSVSERTQVLILSALDIFQDRRNFEPISDADWDEIEGSIGNAIQEILEIVSTGDSLIGSIRLRRNSDFSHDGSGNLAISMEGPGLVSESFQHDIDVWDRSNPSRITNTSSDNWIVWVYGLIRFANDGSNGTRRPKLLKNGVVEIAEFNDSTAANSRTYSMGTLTTLEPGEYLELIAYCNTAVTITSDETSPVLSVAVLGIF